MTTTEENYDNQKQKINLVKDEYFSQEQKMKRMSIAVKGIGGWFAYFTGVATLILGTLNIYEIYKQVDYFLTILGLPILLAGLYLLFRHVKEKNFTGRARIVKIVKVFGGLISIPGLLAIMTLNKESARYPYFSIVTAIGIGLLVISFILKKVWKIKTEKRRRPPIEQGLETEI